MIARESEAIRVRVFTSSVIPGVLQTEAYARGLLRAGLPHDSASETEDRVAARLKRRTRRLDRRDPPLYRAVIDQAALLRPVAGPKVMSDQLRLLLSFQDNIHVRIQVLPLTAGEHGMMGGSLNLLDLESGGTLALVESFRTGEAIEAPREIVEYEELFEAAKESSLSVDDSANLFTRYLQEYDNDRLPPLGLAQE
ncbi:DUF5753 domain-containing protein [Streptomyces alkaliterrae]|uniref:DUF5753 domain-containing protein n=2 Tax=Streptomyces alkaliterrae TaxID=2213162 RepID=A0A7W3WZM2_9ACTN|nr:DUF5753 domain-containing protein [Streptomyces alkaliterrae]MBB1261451.1 hypothetical protein [Streptomyces alkaliterrae]